MTTTQDWVAVVELDEPSPDEDRIDDLMTAYAPFDVSVGETRAGRAELTLTVSATSLLQATATTVAVLTQHRPATMTPVCIRVMSQDDQQTRADLDQVPDLVSVHQAAEMLGLTRQRVGQLIKQGTLPAIPVGGVQVLTTRSVQTYAGTRTPSP